LKDFGGTARQLNIEIESNNGTENFSQTAGELDGAAAPLAREDHSLISCCVGGTSIQALSNLSAAASTTGPTKIPIRPKARGPHGSHLDSDKRSRM
jgi:hypothetical protein